MNMNEQMNQLGQIGSVGYNSTDLVVDQLVGRAKRARAIRQGSAAVFGSLGAISLGLLGAQVFVNLTHDEDAAAIPIRDLVVQNQFGQLKEPGYTGLGKSPEELAAWAKIQSAATIAPAAPAPAAPAPAVVTPKTKSATPACSYEEHPWEGGVKYRSPETNCEWVYPEPPAVPAGWIEFGGIQGKCYWYHDTATNSDVWAAYIDAGASWKKIVKCDGEYVGETGEYWAGAYRHIEGRGTLSGTTCTGIAGEPYKGAPTQFSCNPKKDEWVQSDPEHYKKFDPQCWYYHIATTFEYDGKTWYWDGTQWAEVIPEPEPEP